MNVTIYASSLPPQDPAVAQSIVLMLQCFWITKLGAMASVSLLLHDLLTTLGSESRLVWSRHWSSTKVIFLVNRYITPLWMVFVLYLCFVRDPSDAFCNLGQKLQLVGAMGLTVLQSAVFIGRVWVMYGRTKKALRWVIAGYVICSLPTAVGISLKLYRHHPAARESHRFLLEIPEFDGIYRGCNFTVYPGNFYFLFVANLAYESLLFGVMARKFLVQHGHDGVFHFLFYQETRYFAFMAPVLISALILSLIGPTGLAVVGSGYTVAIKSALTSHMLLNLKKYLLSSPSTGWDGEDSSIEHGMSTVMKFASRGPHFFSEGGTSSEARDRMVRTIEVHPVRQLEEFEMDDIVRDRDQSRARHIEA